MQSNMMKHIDMRPKLQSYTTGMDRRCCEWIALDNTYRYDYPIPYCPPDGSRRDVVPIVLHRMEILTNLSRTPVCMIYDILKIVMLFFTCYDDSDCLPMGTSLWKIPGIIVEMETNVQQTLIHATTPWPHVVITHR